VRKTSGDLERELQKLDNQWREKPKGSMFSLGCSSGCSGNQTVIMFEYESFAGQQAYNAEQLPKLVEKYNELFGGDAYELRCK